MKKWFIALALFLCFSAVAEATYHEVTFKYPDGRTVTDISKVYIYTPGTTTSATIYADAAQTNAITVPITTSSTNSTLSNGTLKWYGPDGYDYWATNSQVYVSNANTGTVTGSTGTLYFPRSIEDYTNRTKCEFKSNPVTSKIAGGAATGTAGDENVMSIDGVNFEYHIIGTATAVAPILVAGGLDVGLDDANDEGVEISRGITTQSKDKFTIGTDAFYLKVKLDIGDVSGTDDCAIGFRTTEAYQAALDDYNNAAVLNVISGNITIETIDDNGATTSTDTTDDWADGASKTLEVYVSAAGVVTYKINGSAPTTTAAFTWDDGDTVVPFIYFLHDSDVAEGTFIEDFECGLQ